MSKNPWLAKPSMTQLRCLAFGHAWTRPQEWREWVADEIRGEAYVYTIRTRRGCSHACGGEQRTTMYVRCSARGNVVEVLKTRHRVVWPEMAHLRADMPRELRPRTRDAYRLELIQRQLSQAVQATGRRMRRADASANIVAVLRTDSVDHRRLTGIKES